MSKDSHFTGQQYWGIFLFEKVLPDSNIFFTFFLRTEFALIYD